MHFGRCQCEQDEQIPELSLVFRDKHDDDLNRMIDYL